MKEVKWNGMYVLHRPGQHKVKLAKTDAAPTAAPAKYSSHQDDKGDITAAALQLQSRLKTVMCANLCLRSEYVYKLFDKAKTRGPEKKGLA